MIIAGMRPQEYADALREARARRAADADLAEPGVAAPDAVAAVEDGDTDDQPASAVDIAPRPPSD